ncbi:MAG: protein kinase [Myxococcales bacterium]|nr:protein kinase [Myxococcales bacterium]
MSRASQGQRSDGADGNPIPVGTRVGDNYRIQRVLGRGSMGIVYLGRDLALERDVAIKILAPHYAADERVAKRFRREAVAMASVRHENVVQIFAFGDHDGRPYFVMEFIPGYTVASLIENANERGEQLYLDVVLGILAQVCRGLQAVHERGIVHRDVKPANMLIGPGFRVALTDFGLVETLANTPGRDLAGTPLYLAPELIRRQALPDKQRHLSDIYALAISTYEMLTGDVPFDGKTIKEILRRHVNQPPRPVSEIRSDLPTAVDDVLKLALSKNPNERPTSCEAFITRLNEARGGLAAPMKSGGRRILLADADPVAREIARTALKVGFPDASIIASEDGLDALERAREARCDLAVVDLDLPGMNGIELCGALSGDEMTEHIPVVVTSGGFVGNSRSVLRSMGIKELLAKPIDATHLVNIARHHLEPEH